MISGPKPFYGSRSFAARIIGRRKMVARQVEEAYGACRIITNLSDYQDSKHLHWHIVSGQATEK